MYSWFADIEERVQTALDQLSSRMDKVENKSNEKHQDTEEQIRTLQKGLKECKKAIEEARAESGNLEFPKLPKTWATQAKQEGKTGQYGTTFRQRLRITNFAPYGCDPKMQINGEDYNKYKRVFEDIFTKEDWKLFTIQNALYKNFQFLVRLPDCETVDEALVRLKR